MIDNVVFGAALVLLIATPTIGSRWAARCDIRRRNAREAAAAETERGHADRTTASYEASDAAGYVDRTGLDTP